MTDEQSGAAERYGQGVYAHISHKAYHADPAPEPSFIAGIGNLLLTRSPAHAWHNHPRLNPAFVPRTASRQMKDGAILHELLLGAGAGIVEIDAENYKTKAAQQEHDAAVEAGKTPVCAPRLAELRGVLAAVWDQLDRHEIFRGLDKLPPGIPEATMIWREGQSWCRARADWLSHDLPLMVDFKFTERSALTWGVGASDRGDDHRAAHYIEGYSAIHPSARGARYLFVVIEWDAPYGLVVHELDAQALSIGERKRGHALAIWETCMRENRWPGYPQSVNRVSLRSYQVTDWEAREQFEDIAA